MPEGRGVGVFGLRIDACGERFPDAQKGAIRELARRNGRELKMTQEDVDDPLKLIVLHPVEVSLQCIDETIGIESAAMLVQMGPDEAEKINKISLGDQPRIGEIGQAGDFLERVTEPGELNIEIGMILAARRGVDDTGCQLVELDGGEIRLEHV